jgi:hypothetical protein
MSLCAVLQALLGEGGEGAEGAAEDEEEEEEINLHAAASDGEVGSLISSYIMFYDILRDWGFVLKHWGRAPLIA